MRSNCCSFKFENQANAEGYRHIAGLDEVGRGALCGPVVAAAVVLPRAGKFDGINDSKSLTMREREILYGEILSAALDIGVGLCRAMEIDRINILNASKLAMKRAVNRMQIPPDCLLVDGNSRIDCPMNQKTIIKGDRQSLSIASASIVAKVIRDRIMDIWDRVYPDYGLNMNKGYATALHIRSLHHSGPSKIHRLTFKRVYDCRILFPESPDVH